MKVSFNERSENFFKNYLGDEIKEVTYAGVWGYSPTSKIDWKSPMRKRGLSQFFVSAYALTVLAKKCNLWSEYQANFKFVFWLYHKDSTIFTSDLTNIEF